MSNSFVKMPSELIFNEEITSLELRVFMALLFWAGVNRQDVGHVKYGAEKLGAQVGIGRNACRKALVRLEALQLISIHRRGNLENESYGLSNDIEITLDKGISYLKNGGSLGSHLHPKDAGDLNLKDAGDLYLKEAGSEGYDLHSKSATLDLKEAGVDLKEAGHIDDRFKIKYNNNKIQRAPAGVHAQKATGDAAPVRSMTDAGTPAEARQKELEAMFDMIDLNNVLLCRENLGKEIVDYQFLKLKGGVTACRPFGKIFTNKAAEDKIVDFWAHKLGAKIAVLAYDTRYCGEIEIKA